MFIFIYKKNIIFLITKFICDCYTFCDTFINIRNEIVFYINELTIFIFNKNLLLLKIEIQHYISFN